MRLSVAWTALLVVAAVFPASSRAADGEITRLEVQPSSLVLLSPDEGRRVLVTGLTSTGERIDLTAETQLEPAGSGVKQEKGFLYAVASGETKVTARARGQAAEFTVTVGDLSNPHPLSFVRDVAPVLNKVGCTSGTCHGSAKGKNGFKLSLRGYDPEYDYNALLFDVSGRRFNRVNPAESLMLSKPTQEVPHEGGLRIEPRSRYYQTIYKWISEGAKFGDLDHDRITSLEVLPSEIFMNQPERKQQVVVIGHYPDGSVRDVTREAVVESNVTTIAEVGEGAVIEGKRVGEAALLVRYEGKFTTVPVTVLNPEPGFQWTALPQNNYIDENIDKKLQRLKIQPASLSDEATFVRRVYLDLIGIPPTTEEARAFLENAEKSRLKRELLIDALMKRKEFIDHWSLKWGDLLQSNRKHLGEKGTWAFRQWIRDSVAANQPYDKMVRELITATGSTYENPAANFFLVNGTAKLAMENTTQLFLGVRMVCTQCHDHPFEKWTQNQYYQLSAFFAAVGVRPGFDSEEEIVYLKRDGFDIKYPKNSRVADPQYLVASTGAPPIASFGDRREALAEWLTSEKNPFFARAIVNRLWSYFFGRGIIEPVDDIRASNPPVNEALLAALAQDFVAHGFDLQHVIRTIVISRTYQAGLETNHWNESDTINFSHFVPRRLSAESILDAITIATGSRPDFPEVPPDFTAQELPDPHVGEGGFLDMFGRPERQSSCECERRTDMSLPQAMNLINGPTLAEAIADPKGRVAQAVLAGKDNRAIVEEMYLAALSRFPSASEMDNALTYLGKGPSRTARAQDLLWALINSNAFLFNR